VVSKEFFRTYLPDKPIQYSYPDFDVRKEYESFKNNIDAVLSVIQYDGETNRYLNFKEWFDKPNQVLTQRVINERYQARGGRYQLLLMLPQLLATRYAAVYSTGMDNSRMENFVAWTPLNQNYLVMEA
jgi:hypothetical protein